MTRVAVKHPVLATSCPMSMPPSHPSAEASACEATAGIETTSPNGAPDPFDMERPATPPPMQFSNSPLPSIIPSPRCHSTGAPSSPGSRSRVRPRTPPLSRRSPSITPSIAASNPRRRLRFRRSPTLARSHATRSQYPAPVPHSEGQTQHRRSMPPDIIMRPAPHQFTTAPHSTRDAVPNSSHILLPDVSLDLFAPTHESQPMSWSSPTPLRPLAITTGPNSISNQFSQQHVRHSSFRTVDPPRPTHPCLHTSAAPVRPALSSFPGLGASFDRQFRSNSSTGGVSAQHTLPVLPPGPLRLPAPHSRTNALEELIALLGEGRPTPEQSRIISQTDCPTTSQSHPATTPLPPPVSLSSVHPSTVPQAFPNALHPSSITSPSFRLAPAPTLPVPAPPIPMASPPRRDFATIFGREVGFPVTQPNVPFSREASRPNNPLSEEYHENMSAQLPPASSSAAVCFRGQQEVPQLRSVPTLLNRSVPRGSAPLEAGPAIIPEPSLPSFLFQRHTLAHSSPSSHPPVSDRVLPFVSRESSRLQELPLPRPQTPDSVGLSTPRRTFPVSEPRLESATERDFRRTFYSTAGALTDYEEVVESAQGSTMPVSGGAERTSLPIPTQRVVTTVPDTLNRRAFSFSIGVDNNSWGGGDHLTMNRRSDAGVANADTDDIRNDDHPQISSSHHSLHTSAPVFRTETLIDQQMREIFGGEVSDLNGQHSGRFTGRMAVNSASRRFVLDDNNDVFMSESAVEDYMNTITNLRLRGRGRGRGGYGGRGLSARSRSGLRMMMNIPRTPAESMLRRSEIRAMVAGREFGVPCGLFEYSVRGRPSLTPGIEWPDIVLITDENVKPRAPVLDMMSENNVQWCVRVGPLGNGEGDGRRGYMAFVHGLIEGGFAIELNSSGGCMYFWALSFPPYGECLLGVFRPTRVSQPVSS